MPNFKQSIFYALNGIKISLREKHIKVHVVIMFLVIIAGCYFKITVTEWLFCLLLFGLVISLEIINTAIEKLTDLVSPNYNINAGKVKDLAAGAVLFATLIAVVGGVIIFTKYVLN